MPGVPALLPSYASIEDPVADLRRACLAAVDGLGPRVRVVADSDLGHRVARHLLASAGLAEAAEDPTGLLVIGNGSAKRTPQAPGHFDERAEVFDDDLRRALLEPLPAALATIDDLLATQLGADVGALRVLADLLTPGIEAEVDYDDAPFGVQYWVIRWA